DADEHRHRRRSRRPGDAEVQPAVEAGGGRHGAAPAARRADDPGRDPRPAGRRLVRRPGGGPPRRDRRAL
ncbi:MAG: hypothetical protein AVDCRST_MAG41-1499, partial [uncultured Corynebacteriales bacterium]